MQVRAVQLEPDTTETERFSRHVSRGASWKGLALSAAQYKSLPELDLARRNVLEMQALGRLDVVSVHTMLSALRQRRLALLEFRSGDMQRHVESVYDTSAPCVVSSSPYEPSAAVLSY